MNTYMQMVTMKEAIEEVANEEGISENYGDSVVNFLEYQLD